MNWTDPSGAILESHGVVEDPFGSACGQLAGEIRGLVEMPKHLPEAGLSRDACSVCEAVRLSSRTRGPESTAMIRDVLDRT